MQGFRCAAVRSVLVVQTLLALPSTLQAQESTLVQNPVESSPSLKEQFRLLRWSPALPPPQWKCWAMGNGARDWRHGDLADCHIFMGHEVNFNSEDIRTLTEGIVANGSDLVHIDFGGSGIGESAGSSEMGHDSSLVPVGRSNGAEALGELLSSSLNLEQVNLERNGFGPTDAMILGNSIASTECPSRLRLGWNAIGPAGGKALAEGLASAESGLRELSLEENALTDAGAQSFASVLALNPSLQLHTLNLDGNQIGALGAKSLGRMFASNRFLWRLSLRNNVLGSAGMHAMVPTESDLELLEHSKAAGSGAGSGLASLDLHGNGIGDDGCVAAASLLRSPLLTSLKQLGLSKNGITDDGAKALAAVIVTPTSRIMTLSLANNKIGEQGAVALLKAVRNSGTVTTLDLRGNSAAMRATSAPADAFKEELGCNLLLIHALGPDWPVRSTAETSTELNAALKAARTEVETILGDWYPGQYRLGPSKNVLPKNLNNCVGKAQRLMLAQRTSATTSIRNEL